MRAKLDSMSEQYRVGDTVELLVATHPKGPRVGSVGVVVCGDELGEPRSTIAVTFASGAKGEPGAAYRVFRHHLRLVAPGSRRGRVAAREGPSPPCSRPRVGGAPPAGGGVPAGRPAARSRQRPVR